MNFHERYRAGEHEAVWTELRALGPALGESGAVEEARLVAVATIDRVHANLVKIAEGLTELGYEFVSVSPGTPDAGSVNAAVTAAAAEALRSHPGLSPEQVEKALASMPQLLGGVAESSFSPTPAEPQVGPRQSPFGNPAQFGPQLAGYEKVVGPAPLALAEFWRRVASVDLTCRAAEGKPMIHWQPLAVLAPIALLDDHTEWKYDVGEGEFHADLIPGPDLGDPPIGADMTFGADSRLATGEWFVDHLRRAIWSGGFLRDEALPPAFRTIAKACEPF
jgi:hypothetical protein